MAREANISLEEREAIFARLKRYLWCMDTGNINGVATNFTPDATIRDVTGKLWDKQAGGVNGFANHFLGPSGRPAGQHWLQPMSVQEAPNDAILVISYWAALSWDPKSNDKTIRVIGAYRDTLVKVYGTWLIREKIIEPWNVDNVPKLAPMI
jgi:hypothetical protein